MFSVCFDQSAEYGAADLVLPARPRALTEDVRLRANQRMLIPLPCKMKTKILKRSFYELLATVE